MKIINIVVLSLLILSVGCKKKDAEVSATATATPAASKAMLSQWYIANSSFSVRLDVGANLTGATFRLIFKCSDTTEIWCDGSWLSGNQTSGTYNAGTGAGTCVSHGGMSAAYAGVFETVGNGSYANDGTNLILTKFNGSSLTYH